MAIELETAEIQIDTIGVQAAMDALDAPAAKRPIYRPKKPQFHNRGSPARN